MADPDPTSGPALDRAEEGRRRLFAALTGAFVTHGYREASEERLINASRLGRADFEALFADREDCFLQAYGEVVSAARKALLASLSADEAWPSRLATALRTALVLIEEHPAEARLVLFEALRATARISARHMATIESLGPFFSEGRELSSSEAQPPAMLDSFLPAGIAFMFGAQLNRDPARALIELYPEALRFLALPYLGDAETDAFVASAATRLGSCAVD